MPIVEPLQPAPFDSSSGTCRIDVLEFLRDDQWVKDKRSVADIVVLVVSEIGDFGTCPFDEGDSNDICGSAFNVPKVLGSHRSESHAFGFLVDNSTCDDELDINGIHEIGHIIGAEHEFVGGVDNNADSLLPDPYNHGYKGFAGTASTVMVSTSN